MRYSRIGNRYKYEMQKHPLDWERWPRDGNIGDCIQSLAVKNLYDELGIAPVGIVNRDDLDCYCGEETVLPFQSWFGNYAGIFPLPWSEKIRPVFIGFHLSKINGTRDTFIQKGLAEKFKECGPIGCRDRSTRDFLLSNGVDAYLSGCMTLTFPKRSVAPTDGRVFLVDLTPAALEIVPDEIRDSADASITHFYYFSEYPVTEKGAGEFEKEAVRILARYEREAKMVVTSKIHCAMPCIAMGIPVIFIHEDVNNERFDILDGIIRRYSPSEASEIDWNPEAANIDELIEGIKNNAFFQIRRYEYYDREREKRLIAGLDKLWDALPRSRSTGGMQNGRIRKSPKNSVFEFFSIFKKT